MNDLENDIEEAIADELSEVFNRQPVRHSGAEMIQCGLRSIEASVGRIADFVDEHPYGADEIVEASRAVNDRFEELLDAVSDATESGGALKSAVQDIESTAGWIGSKFSGEGNQCVSNSFGMVVNSFNDLLVR